MYIMVLRSICGIYNKEISPRDMNVIVSYCNYYSGHDIDIYHLKISTETKMCTAAKLQLGI